MVHARWICQMNTGELYGLQFEATLNKIKHTNAEKLNLGWEGVALSENLGKEKRDLSLKIQAKTTDL